MVCDREGAISAWARGSLVSVFVRQIGVAILLGFVVAHPFSRGLGRGGSCRRSFLRLWRLLRQGLLTRNDILRTVAQGVLQIQCGNGDFVSLLIHGKLGPLKSIFAKLWDLLLFLGLYTVPFSLVCWTSRLAGLRRSRSLELGWLGGLTVVATAAIIATGNGVLRQYNIAYDLGWAPSATPGRWLAGPNICHFYLAWAHSRGDTGLGTRTSGVGQVVWRILIAPQSPASVASRTVRCFLDDDVRLLRWRSKSLVFITI